MNLHDSLSVSQSTVKILDDKKPETLFGDLNSRFDNLATKCMGSELCEKVDTLLEKHDDVLGQLSTHSPDHSTGGRKL